jgi:cephalosporin-C deacetylase-like acetyl esterase
MAENITLQQSNDSGIYKKGENVQVTLTMNAPSAEPVVVKIERDSSKQATQKELTYEGTPLVVFNEILTGPDSVIVEVKHQSETASLGLVVEPEKLMPGTERPGDFDVFWLEEKRALRALPMEVKSVPVDGIEKGYVCFDVEINCTGPKPARGYFAKPESAKPKSLPIVLNLHAAGVSGSWCRSETRNAVGYAKKGNGALCFDLNAHGMLTGQPDAYYADLEENELKGYYHGGLESRGDMYFKGMYLRLVRTLDFLTSQPEWDGKRILAIGESQGGGQALAAAGLDSRVSAAVATVPAMCDFGGSLVGRRGGWPMPFDTQHDQAMMLATVPYFDVAHLLKDSKATLVVEIGLIDTTCSATSIYASINQARGKKIVYPVPYRAHHMGQPAYKDIWGKTVGKPKNDFIESYLK